MEIVAYFENDNDVLKWISLQRDFLPEEVALHDAGVDEGKVSEKSILDDPKRFNQFLKENKYGFYLFNKLKKSVSANVSFLVGDRNPYIYYFQDDRRCKILIKNVYVIIESYILANALLAYACYDEEREYKNRIYVRFEVETVEAWVGRDIKRYLPGIYWITWISNRYASMHKLSPVEIAAEVGAEIRSLHDGHLLQLGQHPSEWRNYLEKIKKYTAGKDNIFFVDKVNVADIKTDAELDKITKKWE